MAAIGLILIGGIVVIGAIIALICIFVSNKKD